MLDAIGVTAYDTLDPDRQGTDGGRGPDLIALLSSVAMLTRYQILITPCGVLGVFDPSTHLTAAMIANLQAWLARGGCLYASDLAYPVVALLRWSPGEHLTVLATGSFVPYEAYEIAPHATALHAAGLALNVAVVAYLVWYLRQRR